mmetsp:Transcript_22982/g.68334  ORF Transcript_22982/g.68334 Transcript_22982/m.68334 type:complete len:236 (+) Transcript_22982:327-1034(+)
MADKCRDRGGACLERVLTTATQAHSESPRPLGTATHRPLPQAGGASKHRHLHSACLREYHRQLAHRRLGRARDVASKAGRAGAAHAAPQRRHAVRQTQSTMRHAQRALARGVVAAGQQTVCTTHTAYMRSCVCVWVGVGGGDGKQRALCCRAPHSCTVRRPATGPALGSLAPTHTSGCACFAAGLSVTLPHAPHPCGPTNSCASTEAALRDPAGTLALSMSGQHPQASLPLHARV